VKIRAKIIFIVLPLIIASLVITGTFSSLSARSGLTRIAMQFLGFKSRELRKYIDNQWNLLVSNNLDDNPEYVDITKQAVASYAATLVRSNTEVIFSINEDAEITMATTEVAFRGNEQSQLKELINNEQQGWVEFQLENKPRVGHLFYYPAFEWYYFVSEEQETFYKEVEEITVQSGIILGGSLFISLVLLFIFSGYLTRPLQRVERSMKEIIRNNDLSERVTVEYNDEIGNLAHTFNIMVGELERAYKQIKGFAFKAVLAQKNEHKVRNIFQKYVPKDVIENVFRNPESMLVGENRVLAILFSDIRSFTTISEGFMPDELVGALNRYFEIMVEIIMNRGGVIDKYIGDAIMAFFGAPVKHKDDALQALWAAIEMQEALTEFNREQQQAGKPAFITGIGLNYGVVTVGNIGSEKKMDYTVIGDMVNLGSRLEGLTKPYKQHIIFSQSVYQKVKADLPCRLVDKVVVKGKTQGEKIFTAKRELSDREREGWSFYHQALKRYYKRDFRAALELFRRTLQKLPDDYLANMYIERCRNYIKTPPPPEWNGVEVLTSK
jgi:class 3 adenylate cyclase/HAMP domain-containing protein